VSNDIIKRVFTGAVLIAIICVVLLIDRILLPLFLMVYITFATNEYFRFWHRKDIYPHTMAVLVPGYAIPLLFYYEAPLLIPCFLLFFFVCLLSVMRFPGSRRIPNFLAEVSAAVFGIIYVSLLPSTLIPLRKIGFGVAILPLVLTWLYDTFAYLAGSTLGKHKLAETVSPHKTWEGTILAFPLTFPFVYFLGTWLFPSFQNIDAVLITLGIGIFATVADLFESGMKREVHLKDTSNIFPGHGGFLDRLDSLIFNIPFMYLYLTARQLW
jgi:phosphatidate cytidylyltransferase